MKQRKPIKYGASKLLLASGSVFAFGLLAALVARQPIASSAATQSSSQTSRSITAEQANSVFGNDDDSGYRYYQDNNSSARSSAPVARSRGS